jgi:hypothetical protein
MAKSKPIGVRFDLDKLDIIQKEQNLTSVQQVVNYLMDNYGSKEVKRGAPFKNMPPYHTEASKLKEALLSRICLLITQRPQIWKK